MANFWGTLPPQIFFSSGGNVWYLVAICGSVTGGGGNRWHSPYLRVALISVFTVVIFKGRRKMTLQ